MEYIGETTSDTECRKWLITINNPIEKGYTHEVIVGILKKISALVYWCMGEEVGDNGTYHIHIYVHSTYPKKRRVFDNKFKGGHFDKVRGTAFENRAYVFKEGEKFNKDETTGKYEYVDKKGKVHKGIHDDSTHKEWGELPDEKQGKRSDITELYTMIKEGMTNYEIMEINPRYMLNLDKVEKARQVVKEEEFKDRWRDLEVCYIWGTTGAGKTRGVMEQYGYSNVYRVTDYAHPFDAYKGQDVLVFEEFRSSLPIDDMLKYLDGYPVELPARYMNRIACFTKVYIITNIDIRCQYPNMQREQIETWNAFLRRIHTVKTYNGHDSIEIPLQTYLDCENPFLITTPFDKGGVDNV